MSANQMVLLPDAIEKRFQKWIRANPHVVDHVRELALKWLDTGHNRCGIGMLCEVARWHGGIDTTDEAGFRINNDYRALLARHLIATTPRLPVDFFETRVRPSAEANPNIAGGGR